MPTLNYASFPPQQRIVTRAKIHLLVWSILFFFVALAIATCGILTMFLVVRENRGTELLLPFVLCLVIYGGIAFPFAAMGFNCLRVGLALTRNNPSYLTSAETLFAIFSALCLFVTLIIGVVVLSFLIFKKNSLEDAFWISLYAGCPFLLLTVLTRWTKRTIFNAQDTFPPDPSQFPVYVNYSDRPPPPPQ